MTEDHTAPLSDEPLIIAAFEGWNDAGSAATTALHHLHDVWGAELVDAIDPEEFHDFQVNRPVIAFDAETGGRRISWPTTHFAQLTTPVQGRTVILVHGIEPSLRWRTYCEELLDTATRLGGETLVTLGALLADVPHTRPIPVTISSEDTDVRHELGVQESTYEGPTGIIGVLQHAALDRGIPGLSTWAAVPHYVAQPPSPKATLAILTRLEEIVGEPIPLRDLPDEAEAWRLGVDELASEDAEIAEYVAQLEQAKDTAELPEASGEAIAQEFERYLRRRDKGDRGPAGS